MITLELARLLKSSGTSWTPANGDRFVVPDREMDDRVFVVSDMVVEVHGRRDGDLLAFNGTTEWALDSIPQHEVVWLPREEQLRGMLADRFRSLTVTPDGYLVVVEGAGGFEQHLDRDAECAYARAVLSDHRER